MPPGQGALPLSIYKAVLHVGCKGFATAPGAAHLLKDLFHQLRGHGAHVGTISHSGVCHDGSLWRKQRRHEFTSCNTR